MPFESEKQRRFMYAKHPAIAKRWEAEGKGYVKGKSKDKPRRKRKEPSISMA